MKDGFLMIKKLVLGPLSLSILLLGACNFSSDKIDSSQTEPLENEITTYAENPDMKIIENHLKEEFKKEQGVSDFSLVISEDAGGFILLDFEVDENMKEKDAKLIVKKYNERLEKEYPEHNIDIQARKSGETFVQETKEVK